MLTVRMPHFKNKHIFLLSSIQDFLACRSFKQNYNTVLPSSHQVEFAGKTTVVMSTSSDTTGTNNTATPTGSSNN